MIPLVELTGPVRGLIFAGVGLLFWFGGLAFFYWFFRRYVDGDDEERTA